MELAELVHAAGEGDQGAWNSIVERFGGLHVMCNNAGISGPRRRFLDDELADFETQMRVNVFGVPETPMRAVGRSDSTAVKRSAVAGYSWA